MINIQRYLEIAGECQDLADEMETKGFRILSERVDEGVRIVERSWSRSWLGYQSHVYYRDFEPPPPGDHFSSEWGFENAFSNPTSENWIEVGSEDVSRAIYEIADNPNDSIFRVRSTEVSKLFFKYQAELNTLLTVDLETTKSDVIEELKNQAKGLKAFYSANEIALVNMPEGNVMTRDSLALSQGLQTPPTYYCVFRI